VSQPRSVRITALTSLATLAPSAALDLATSLLKDSSVYARTSAIQALRRLGADGRARLDAAVAADATLTGLAAAPGPRAPNPPPPTRSETEYRHLVEQWIVPAYTGGPAPHVVFETPRGSVEVELYPGDAPFGVEYLLDVVKTGAIVGSEFGRVVPNFVAQEDAIRPGPPVRDEVSRRGLTRGNLSWATGGLDTGHPGYTLGSTPQPHNEGDFTALGHVVRGMDVVDRIELGDKITGAHLTK
jgi:cyclophilin family peptidyl-prolyl cis-trans isomerase